MVTAGAWYLFMLSLDRFLFPVMSLSSFWTIDPNRAVGRRTCIRANRCRAAVVKQIDSQPVPKLKGEIDFEHVDFYYKSDEPVLQDFTLHIAPGREHGAGGAYRRGKIIDCQADRALLRVSGRRRF